MCHSAVYVAISRLNLNYTRPIYVLAKANIEKQEKLKKDFEVLKKYFEEEINHILFNPKKHPLIIYMGVH